VLSYADIAVAEGGRVLVGGKRAPGFAKGYYLQPTAVLAADNSSRVCQEEIFGPFATFLLFDTEEQAIELANDTPFGLSGYVWTRDVTKALAVSQRIRAGTVWVNSPVVRELRAPFGGYKQSGIGRDGMAASMDFFTEQKTTSVPLEKLTLRAIGAG
jgi:5-carboxymethyl-2-hydroxymuconic-semialdehyde dehydrogenase